MTHRFGRYIFFMLLFLGISCGAIAQIIVRPMRRPPPRVRENRLNKQQLPKVTMMQQKRLDYISMQLALPPEQTIKFEALYVQYMREKTAVLILQRINNSPAQANGTDQVNKAMEYEQELVDIKQHYTEEFSKIMPPEKVSVIFKSEQEFNNEAVRISREQKSNGPTPVN